MLSTTPKRNNVSNNGDSDVPGTPVTPHSRVLKVSCFNIGDKALENESSPSLDLEKTLLSPGEARRGRPRADLLNTLILEGATSPSSIKCTYCNRVFPREKSLQAHLRTHTGEKPYVCDYPRCSRRFAQSGQLKTHQRLHTGEKPFVCGAPNCKRRFTHANGHCPDHAETPLKRFITKPEPSLNKSYDETHTAEIREWLQNYDKRNKNSPECNENLYATPKKLRREDFDFSSGSSAYFSGSSQNGLDLETSPKCDLDDLETSICCISGKSESEMLSEMRGEMSPGRGPESVETSQPRPSELPKKRWLRVATQEQRMWDSTDLASPLNWGEDNSADTKEQKEDPEAVERNRENQKRPSVLVCVQGGKSKEISNEEIQGAMALVELKNCRISEPSDLHSATWSQVGKGRKVIIRLLDINMQLIRSKTNELETFLIGKQVNIICLSEHWLTERESMMLNLTGYRLTAFYQSDHSGVDLLFY